MTILTELYGNSIKMKKVMVLGCVGMAGHVVADYLSNKDDYDIYGVARSEGKFVTHALDVTDFDRLHDLIKTINPDYIINWHWCFS